MQRLGSELYSSGGATVDTAGVDGREPTPDAVIRARTVIQPDGDVVCFATYRYCVDAELRDAHHARVAEWYAGAESTLTRAVGVLRTLSLAAGVAIGTLAGGLSGAATSRPWGLVAGVGVGVGFALLVSVLVSAVVHSRLRRLASSLLGRR